jgi:hypothetical protein
VPSLAVWEVAKRLVLMEKNEGKYLVTTYSDILPENKITLSSI